MGEQVFEKEFEREKEREIYWEVVAVREGEVVRESGKEQVLVREEEGDTVTDEQEREGDTLSDPEIVAVWVSG